MSMVCDSFLTKDISILKNFIDISLSDKKLEFDYLQILNYFLKNPGKNTLDIKKSLLEGLKNKSERTLYRYTDDLYKKYKLTELVTEKVELLKGTESTYKKPYRLSLNGIFYVIFNTFNITYDDLIKYLSINYKNNVLFKIFLYPFIREQTINAIIDSGFFSIVALYLRGICNEIINSINILKNMISVTPDGFMLDQVFVWPNDSKDFTIDFTTINLRNFLNNVLEWSWIKDAKITPNFENNRIDITYPQDSLKNSNISIYKSGNKAFLRQQGKKIHEFSITNNKSFLSVETKTERKLMDVVEMPLIYKCKEHLFTFLNKLRTQITIHNVSFDILSSDTSFKKAIEFMDKEIKIK